MSKSYLQILRQINKKYAVLSMCFKDCFDTSHEGRLVKIREIYGFREKCLYVYNIKIANVVDGEHIKVFLIRTTDKQFLMISCKF